MGIARKNYIISRLTESPDAGPCFSRAYASPLFIIGKREMSLDDLPPFALGAKARQSAFVCKGPTLAWALDVAQQLPKSYT